jgi:hypothetical protein
MAVRRLVGDSDDMSDYSEESNRGGGKSLTIKPKLVKNVDSIKL